MSGAGLQHAVPGTWRLAAGGDEQCSLLEDITVRPEVVMDRGRVLKHDGTTTVALVGDGTRQWVMKRYNTKNRWHAVRRLVQTSRAVNCWHAASWLRQAGIDTPRRIAALEERRFARLRGRSLFVCEFVEGETLNRALATDGGDTRLVERSAAMVQRLRQHGIVHGDLKATNFIVCGERIFLLDLDAARRPTGRRLAAGLGKDLDRFLRNWRDTPELMREFTRLLPG